MRELKFRAWDNIHKKMLSWKELFGQAELLRSVLCGETYMTNPPKLLATPMQYTGLKDKNGVEIYEKDLIQLQKPRSKQAAVVEFKNEYVGGWVLTHPTTCMHLSLGARTVNEVLVVGNIYENPELLEPTKASAEDD